MKFKKVIINGKTYYEEVVENKEVVEPEIVDPKDEDDFDDIKFKEQKKHDNLFDKKSIDEACDALKKGMNDLGNGIKKGFGSAKAWFSQQNKKSKTTTDKLVKILPYMDEEDIHEIVMKMLHNDEDFKDVDLAAIMPFISEEDCNALFLKKIADGEPISVDIVHFVSEDCLTYLVDAYIEGKYPNLDVDSLYPFLDGDDVKKLFYFELRKSKEANAN